APGDGAPGGGAPGDGAPGGGAPGGGVLGGGVLAGVAPAGVEGGDVARAADVPGDAAAPLVLRGSLDRESLRLSVVKLRTPAERLGAGIVYTLTIQSAEDVAEFLRERGHRVAAYTGKTEPEERLAAEADLLANRVKALVATSALGMGFDKP